MKARLGIAPIAWSNDDLPELGGKTSLQTCLSESRKSGFSGVETGGKFPKSAVELKKVLSEHNLSLCGGWYSGTLLDKEIEDELIQIKGIGKWTIEMFMIFILFRLNVFSKGDVALINSIKSNYNIIDLSNDQLNNLISKWSPHNTIASLILWKSIENRVFYDKD